MQRHVKELKCILQELGIIFISLKHEGNVKNCLLWNGIKDKSSIYEAALIQRTFAYQINIANHSERWGWVFLYWPNFSRQIWWRFWWVVHSYSMHPQLSRLFLNLGNILIRPRLFAERNLPVKEPLGFWLCYGILLYVLNSSYVLGSQ